MMREKRENLCVTVPTLFRCPISMDVMKSPVSLCTGVTYDRSSIEKWLSLGHATCPATMQTLFSTHTTPNLTLRRLITLWLSHPGGTPTPPLSLPTSISKQQVREVINGALNCDSLAKIIHFMKVSDDNLKFIAFSDDAVSNFVEFFGSCKKIEACELIVEILDLILLENGAKEKFNSLILKSDVDCLSSFLLILREGSMESKIKSARILESIAFNSESQLKIAEKEGILYELYTLIAVENDRLAIQAALSSLLAISSSRLVRKELIRFGIVKRIGEILSIFDFSSTVRAVIEKSLGLLEMVATCTEGREGISEDEKCVAEIVKRLMKCSNVATEHSITVIWSVCCLARDRTAQDKVMQVNGLTKVLLVMQSDCSVSTRQMCRELVKVLRVNNSKSCFASYETMTTHIMPY
ncbi:U-box domain-containing 28-like [Olea europaea subsp. europaea]|uniref:U-box domain-containing protein n=1 Tax=Olea europaea subsp. europaea TaxID=158383 RepID=A0A8S0U105_OLEEU|nr:U-box domain-containing 28-like [Olea europaea subsp. europaea]